MERARKRCRIIIVESSLSRLVFLILSSNRPKSRYLRYAFNLVTFRAQTFRNKRLSPFSGESTTVYTIEIKNSARCLRSPRGDVDSARFRRYTCRNPRSYSRLPLAKSNVVIFILRLPLTNRSSHERSMLPLVGVISPSVFRAYFEPIFLWPRHRVDARSVVGSPSRILRRGFGEGIQVHGGLVFRIRSEGHGVPLKGRRDCFRLLPFPPLSFQLSQTR